MDLNVKQQAEQTEEELEQEEAAFEAGFNDTDIEPASETNLTESQEPAEETDIEPSFTEQPAPVTMDDVRALLDAERLEGQKKLDKVFGKVGELQQKIDAARATTAGISPQARGKLEKDFPELAAMLFDPADTTPAPEAKQEPYYPPDTLQDDGVDPVTIQVERKFLTRDHPDWEKVVVDGEFLDWKSKSLSAEESEKMDTTWDSNFVSAKLTEFKSWKAAEAARLKQAADRKAEEASALEDAITPRGQRRVATSRGIDEEEAAMMESYGRK